MNIIGTIIVLMIIGSFAIMTFIVAQNKDKR